MSTISTRFDGQVFVPDQPVDLPPGTHAEVDVPSANEAASANSDQPQSQPEHNRPKGFEDHVLGRILAIVEQTPADPNAPTDGAAEHDHYLYGTPKKYDQ